MASRISHEFTIRRDSVDQNVERPESKKGNEKTKKTGKVTLREKRQIIDDYREGKHSVRSLSQKYNVDRKTIREAWEKREKILSINLVPKSKKKHAVRAVKYEIVDAEVLEALKLYREKNVPVTGVLLKDEAMYAASQHSIVGFSASDGWLRSFRDRNDVFFRSLHGESASVVQAVVDEHFLKLPSVLTHYAPKDRLNADEFALFFRAIPKKSLLFAGESLHGGKVAKERVSVLIIGSAFGPEFLPIIIGSSAKPRAFAKNGIKERAETKARGFHYYSNKSAWMTMQIFENIVDLLNSEMITQNRRVVLFVDNFSGHKVASRSNVTVEFFLPNITSVAQPLDAGIIKAKKDYFRKEMFKDLRSKLHTFSDVSEYIKTVTVHEACMWSVSALKSIKLFTWKNCFAKCKFVADEDFSLTASNTVEEDSIATASEIFPVSAFNLDAELHSILAFY